MIPFAGPARQTTPRGPRRSGNALRRLRIAAGLTQSQVAERLHASRNGRPDQSGVSRLERRAEGTLTVAEITAYVAAVAQDRDGEETLLAATLAAAIAATNRTPVQLVDEP